MYNTSVISFIITYISMVSEVRASAGGEEKVRCQNYSEWATLPTVERDNAD